jgi:hypothetical protein
MNDADLRQIHHVVVRNKPSRKAPKGTLGSVVLDYETAPMVASALELERWVKTNHPGKAVTVTSRPA